MTIEVMLRKQPDGSYQYVEGYWIPKDEIRYYSRTVYEKCPVCKGTGVNHYNDNDPCGVCSGDGVVIKDK
jgi:hypothetical protein